MASLWQEYQARRSQRSSTTRCQGLGFRVKGFQLPGALQYGAATDGLFSQGNLLRFHSQITPSY